ncbi:TonB-dependent receptor [Sphingomonas sp. HF-S4]|uniref:TonB-dependent receptor n=1 Tax=Sphingomonas agrestis TaxID=3080540 RepID=A0ABU3YA90_9SPHN|nr:TonB-dependent receptor [Sphingomonas sp. HF-S4]MDV3458047.1 TonB-dependent receptor [Sphingomonas sp. HF-S4]
MKKTQITRGLRGGTALSALVLAGTLFAAPAFAQDTQTVPAEDTAAQEDSSSGDIVVTGSLFRRTDTETASPVTVLSAESLQQRGINTVAEAVQRVSANGAGTITQGWNTGSNFATGANAVSLRGLTVQSTLTIFDGQRMAPYPLADDGHRNFVDLNTIPNAIIERIEILRDGASSTYGADAVAGVVNVITKKEIKGLHLNASAGISELGDAPEQRFDATWGYGDLDEQGFNFYINGEYQRNEALWARDRKYPFGTSDLSGLCGTSLGGTVGTGATARVYAPGSKVCMTSGVWNSVIPSNATSGPGFIYNGLIATPVAVGRPVDATGAVVPGNLFRLLNPAAGCRNLTPVTVPSVANGGAATSAGTTQCSLDPRAEYSQLQPEQERMGFAGRFTAKVGDNAEFYASANYYQVKTHTQLAPLAFNGGTAYPPPTPAGFVQPTNVFLPVYVCPTGVGSFGQTGNLNTGCTAANGVLNPNNPYAASGSRAQLLYRYDRPRDIQSKSRSLRAAVGINGSFGEDWNYSVEATASQVQLDIIQNNFLNGQRIADVLARGTYNFINPDANSEAIRDYIAPENNTRSTSDLWQVSGTLSKSLFELPGGPLQTAVGVAYRHESINNPSANPENLANPYDRYYSVNAVGAVGSREVKSAFFEVSAPVVPQLEINASGRYDDYSSGQSNFSPKIGAKFTPIPQVAVRGTWSKGFRIPSFNEAYGLPTTGYVNFQLSNSVPAEQAFINAHGGNSYATGGFPVGLTSTGNAALDPEKSTSWTVGAIFEPIRNVSFTVDYFHIKVTDIIGGADYSDVQNQYYANNGVVNIPGITVLPGAPDINFPNALPHIGFIQYSFQNNDSQSVSGLDFGANFRKSFGDVTFSSSLEASYLIKFEKTIGDNVQRYDGTLSPCDVTSCSGAPKWRGSWQNTVEVGGFTGSVTAYYTSGYDLASIDYGGVKGDCLNNVGASVSTYADNVTPVLCEAKAQWNVDLSLSQKVGDNFTIYANVLNVLGIDPVFDPSAAYHIFQFNPAWGGPNIMGRYFRVGARVSF